MDPLPCARSPRHTRWTAAALVACATVAGCDGVREIGARAASRLAESLGAESPTIPDTAPITPTLSWTSRGFGAGNHVLEVRAPVGTRVFIGSQEQTVEQASGTTFTLDELQVVEHGEAQLVAPDGTITRLSLPEIPGPRLADVVRLTDCFALEDHVLASGPVVGLDACPTMRDRLSFSVPEGARATLAGKTITAERSAVTFTLDAGALALAQDVRIDDPPSHRTSDTHDVVLPLRVQWRGQTLETTVELRFGKQAIDVAVRSAIGWFQQRTLDLPGTTDTEARARALIAVVGDEARVLGRPGTLGGVDLVAVHELLDVRADGRCGPYGEFGWGNSYIPRKARDERWTVYDARTRAVVATRTFKATRAECPYSVRLTDETSVQSRVASEPVMKWLGGLASNAS